MDLYSPELLELGKSDDHYEKRNSADHQVKAINSYCGDKFTMFFDYSDTVSDASFHGYGCVVARAAAALVIEEITDRSWTEIKDIATQNLHYLDDGTEYQDMDERMRCFAPVRNYPGRQECAALAWKEILKYVNAQEASE